MNFETFKAALADKSYETNSKLLTDMANYASNSTYRFRNIPGFSNNYECLKRVNEMLEKAVALDGNLEAKHYMNFLLFRESKKTKALLSQVLKDTQDIIDATQDEALKERAHSLKEEILACGNSRFPPVIRYATIDGTRVDFTFEDTLDTIFERIANLKPETVEITRMNITNDLLGEIVKRLEPIENIKNLNFRYNDITGLFLTDGNYMPLVEMMLRPSFEYCDIAGNLISCSSGRSFIDKLYCILSEEDADTVVSGLIFCTYRELENADIPWYSDRAHCAYYGLS